MPSPFFKGLGETVLGIFKDEAKAVFKPQNGYPQPLEVIFNARHQAVDVQGQEIGAPNPTAWFRTGLITPVYGDTLEVVVEGTSINYRIINVAPDGLELTQLDLDEPA